MNVTNDTKKIVKYFLTNHVDISIVENIAKQSLKVVDLLDETKKKLKLAEEKNQKLEEKNRKLEETVKILQLKCDSYKSNRDSCKSTKTGKAFIHDENICSSIESTIKKPKILIPIHLDLSKSSIFSQLTTFNNEKNHKHTVLKTEDNNVKLDEKGDKSTRLKNHVQFLPIPTVIDTPQSNSDSKDDLTLSPVHQVKHFSSLYDNCTVCNKNISLSESFICQNCDIIFHRKCYINVEKCLPKNKSTISSSKIENQNPIISSDEFIPVNENTYESTEEIQNDCEDSLLISPAFVSIKKHVTFPDPLN